MPTPNEIRQSCNAHLRQLLGQLHQKQHVYHAITGRYFQGKRTHQVTPKDGIPALPDNLSDRPGDQPDTWGDLGITFGAMECSVTCESYSGSLGDGYAVIMDTTIGNQTWRRIAQVGPEVERTRGWHQV